MVNAAVNKVMLQKGMMTHDVYFQCVAGDT